MKSNYQELLREVGEQNFDSRFGELLKQISAFLDEAEYDENVVCNERILYHVLLDYYADIARLKDFHEIRHTKTDKKFAYLIYWIIKRKPIQFREFSDEEKDIFVNERFCCYLLINECLLQSGDASINTNLNEEKMIIFDRYIDMLLYYFKYRQINAQMIELVIETFKVGRLFPVID